MDVGPDGSCAKLDTRPVLPDRTFDIGREGDDLGIGVDPFDAKVSRHAVRVTSTGGGWRVEDRNTNRSFVQYWGQPWLPHLPVADHAWPRIAVHIIGTEGLRHLVLLDDPALTVVPARPARTHRVTESNIPPMPLTEPQLAALRTVFRELLDWPPRARPRQRQLKQAARILGIGREAVQRRLEQSREKAYALGLSRAVSLTDPEYLYALVRAGYVAPSDEDLDPLLG
jgi:hypothetical protein